MVQRVKNGRQGSQGVYRYKGYFPIVGRVYRGLMDLTRCIYMDTNKHDIIVTEAFCAALFRVKIAASEGGSEGECFIRRSQ